eukprot:scaffold52849_cov33-Tisochrysis_lutea.AAC.2
MSPFGAVGSTSSSTRMVPSRHRPDRQARARWQAAHCRAPDGSGLWQPWQHHRSRAWATKHLLVRANRELGFWPARTS